jgi:hypothetical protein
MERKDYEDLNPFSKKDFEEENEENAELVEEWRKNDDSTSSRMFDH